MKGSGITAAVAAGLLAFSSLRADAGVHTPIAPHTHTPGAIWAVFGCTGGVIAAALAANYIQKRQLTWREAASCGLLFWLTPPRRP